jgi:hypothetical protein
MQYVEEGTVRATAKNISSVFATKLFLSDDYIGINSPMMGKIVSDEVEIPYAARCNMLAQHWITDLHMLSAHSHLDMFNTSRIVSQQLEIMLNDCMSAIQGGKTRQLLAKQAVSAPAEMTGLKHK